MKKVFVLPLAILLLLGRNLSAQIPQGINYQSVARDASGNILLNHLVSIQFSVHDSTPIGPVVYRENQTISTNAFGIFSTVIGTGNTIIGHFPNINWNGAGKFLEILMDFNGGSNYVSMGTSPFMSVPYSLYAGGSAGDIINVKYDTTGVLNLTAPSSTLTTGKGVWTTAGNAGLNNTNFIGTLDNSDLILKGHNVEALRMTSGGAILATGNPSGATPASGAGSRMMWIPGKSAFRAGAVSGTAWDNPNVGPASVAMGYDALASGPAAVVIGSSSAATAPQSAAYGNGLIAKSAGEIVMGAYNDTTGSGSATSWNGGDALFQIGNGTASSRGNALTITKNGNITAGGMQMTGGLVMSPSASPLPVLTTLTTLSVGSQSYLTLSSLLAPGLNSVILGSGSKVGQLLIIEVFGLLPGAGIRFSDGNGMNLSTTNIDLLNQGTISLIWDGNTWVETAHSIN